MRDAYSILRIVDGSTKRSILRPGKGISLKSWVPNLEQFKAGGIYQDSPFSEYRVPVDFKRQSATETFELAVDGWDVDELVDYLRDYLFIHLENGLNYWTTWATQLVYLEARSPKESKSRFAIITGYSVPSLGDNPYTSPLQGPHESALPNLTLTIERGPWLALAPGTSEAMEVNGLFTFPRIMHTIGNSTNDVWVNHVGSTIDTGGTTLSMGRDTTPVDEETEGGFRFESIVIPAGSTITQAYIKFKASSVAGSPGPDADPLIISGELALSPGTFSTYVDFNGRTKTAAKVNWFPETQAADNRFSTPDISSILEEIIGQSGWSSGNDVVLFAGYEDTTTADDAFQSPVIVKTSDHVDGDAPPLLIVYFEEGQSDTTTNDIYVSNKFSRNNIRYVKTYDDSGASFTDQYPAASFPFNLSPSPWDQNDYIAFGVDDVSAGSGASYYPFSGIVLDIGTAFGGVTADLTWQYYNGAWTTLTVQDNTDRFRNTGVGSVHFEPPTDWVEFEVHSVTAFWVRCIKTTASTATTATQQTSDIYSPIQPYVDTDDIQGDIPAYVRAEVTNQSDANDSSSPVLDTHRLIIGSRSYDRGDDFTAYLNITDSEDPFGTTTDQISLEQKKGLEVTLGTDTAWADTRKAPTGRTVTYTAVTLNSWVTVLNVEVNGSVSGEFTGRFRLYLRVFDQTFTSTKTKLRMQITNGLGGLAQTTASQTILSTTDYEILDFGSINLKPLKGSVAYDSIKFSLQGYSFFTSSIFSCMDLVLIPVDEWAGMFTDETATQSSALGNVSSVARYLDIDGLTDPKAGLRALNRVTTNQLTVSEFTPATNGPMVLQPHDRRQRLWFFASKLTGGTWTAKPDIVHSVLLYKNERYIGLRGND